MRWLRILFMLLCFGGAAFSVRAEQVPARLAAAVMPVPTFDDVHRAYMRIVVNESGFKSLADQDGILQALLWRGGGRKAGRRGYGYGWGLDYRSLMKRMIAHSRRTFPPDSKFLTVTHVQRLRLEKRQTRRNRWTSTLQLDCSEPEGWPEMKRDGSRRMDPWRSHYGKRCRLVVETTRAFLQGRMETHCDGDPTTWGSVSDIYRPGGAHDNDWLEISCDRPHPKNPDYDCDKLTRQQLLNSKFCAKNHFWTWLEKEQGDGEGTVSERGDAGTRGNRS